MENKVKTTFEFTDEFGNVSNLTKIFDACIIEDGSFDFLVDEFKSFMRTMFLEDMVNQITVDYR